MQAAEARSFTLAGQRLGISSSAVGKAVARLEERLGVKLLHRSTRSITLTPEGSMFLARCRQILAEMEAAELELSQTREKPTGLLRVSMPLVGMLMMPTLSAFMETWPDIELDIDFTDRVVDVIEEGFDAVIRTGDVSDSRLMTRTLGEVRFKLVGTPAYFERNGVPSRVEELTSHRCLLHRYPSTGKFELWFPGDGDGVSSDNLPRAAVSNAIEPLLEMTKSGLGVACLPDFSVNQYLESGQLISVLDDTVKHSATFRLLWPSSRFVSPKVRVFVDYLANSLFLATTR
ncbi:LysR family transcriptional regulator [Tsuneonella suprasediminis]|uniref:LysR family transcriptional regulator n=1 Tax=Tsuneonella suprasediminis TaxID=2306996 RepID=A0A419QXT9_9SPHN|nr:LysR family transcriptional regulator [Tsuneonella suprasediminis]RJX65454.1 LysR family transcriptional regulator [Tsuneonella suprasediminis]